MFYGSSGGQKSEIKLSSGQNSSTFLMKNPFFSFDGSWHSWKLWLSNHISGFPDGASVKQPTCQCQRLKRDVDSIPGPGRFPGGGHGNSHQYYCLENPMDRRAWWATIHSVTNSWTPLKRLSMHKLKFLPLASHGLLPCVSLC